MKALWPVFPLKRMALVPVLAFLLGAAAAPMAAAPVYSLEGTLSWLNDSGPDLLTLDGLSFSMTLALTSGPTASPDANGIQYGYGATGTLLLGGVIIPIQSASASLFSATDATANDVANFYLTPVSGDPAFYYPAVILAPGTNAGAGSTPPIYSVAQALDAFLLIPAAATDGPALNAVYRILDLSFTTATNGGEIPEPASFLLAGSAIAAFGLRRPKRRPQ